MSPCPAFLVFGAERSGTTLLAFLLSGQPDTFVVNDSFVFDQLLEWALLRDPDRARPAGDRPLRLAAALAPELAREAATGTGGIRSRYYAARERRLARLAPDRVLAPDEIAAFHAFLVSRYRYSLGYDRDNFLNDYAEALAPLDAPQRIDALVAGTLAALARRYGAREGAVIGEKTPVHTFYAAALLRSHLEARAILLVRDPVATVGSLLRHTRSLPRALETYAMYASRFLALKDHERVLVVRHEDVAAHTPEVIARVLAFIDPRLRFDPACRVNAYTKAAYTGTTIDPARARGADHALDPADRDRIRRRFRGLYEAFYG